MNWLKRLLGRAPATEKPQSVPPLSADERERALVEIDGYARRDVAGGFRTESDIVQGVTEVLSDEFKNVDLSPLVAQRTRELLLEHEQAQAAWPSVTDCDRLDRAFAELESRGIVCRQDFTCCGTCGSAEIGDEMAAVSATGMFVRGYAFYHMQDTEAAVDGHGLYLGYGATEEGELAAVRIGHEICDALKAQSLAPDWDGSWQTRIKVPLDWKRRRKPTCSAR